MHYTGKSVQEKQTGTARYKTNGDRNWNKLKFLMMTDTIIIRTFFLQRKSIDFSKWDSVACGES